MKHHLFNRLRAGQGRLFDVMDERGEYLAQSCTVDDLQIFFISNPQCREQHRVPTEFADHFLVLVITVRAPYPVA